MKLHAKWAFLTSIVFISDFTFSSSSTGSMGLLITFIGTWWTSAIPAECTLLSADIAPVTGSVITLIARNLLKNKHGAFLAISILRVLRKRLHLEYGIGNLELEADPSNWQNRGRLGVKLKLSIFHLDVMEALSFWLLIWEILTKRWSNHVV